MEFPGDFKIVRLPVFLKGNVSLNHWLKDSITIFDGAIGQETTNRSGGDAHLSNAWSMKTMWEDSSQKWPYIRYNSSVPQTFPKDRWTKNIWQQRPFWFWTEHVWNISSSTCTIHRFPGYICWACIVTSMFIPYLGLHFETSYATFLATNHQNQLSPAGNPNPTPTWPVIPKNPDRVTHPLWSIHSSIPGLSPALSASSFWARSNQVSKSCKAASFGGNHR